MAKKRICFDNLLLHLARQAFPNVVSSSRSVQQEDCARCGVFEHVNLVHEFELMAGYEARLIHEVG